MEIHLSLRVRELCSNVTNLVGWIYIVEIQEQKHTGAEARSTHAPGMRPGVLTLNSWPMSARPGDVIQREVRGVTLSRPDMCVVHCMSSARICCCLTSRGRSVTLLVADVSRPGDVIEREV